MVDFDLNDEPRFEDLSSTFVSQNRSGLDTNLASSEDSSAGELDLNAEPDILELTMEAQEDEDNLQHDHDNGEFDLNVEPEEEGDDILDLTIELQEDEENLQHEQDTAGFDLNLEPVQDVDDIPDLTAGIQEEKCKNCLRACSDCPRGIP